MYRLICTMTIALMLTSTTVHAWAGLVCNYSTRNVSVKFEVAASSPFTLPVPAKTNSANRDVGGLCFSTITAWVTGDKSQKIALSPSGSLISACGNRIVMIYDVPKENKAAGYMIAYTPGISPESTCLQP